MMWPRAWQLYERMKQSIARLAGRSKADYVWHRTEQYRNMWESAAQALGLEFEALSGEVWQVRSTTDGFVSRIANHAVELDNPVTLNIAADKPLTYRLLKSAGLPVPPHSVFTLSNTEPLRQFVAEHEGPYVVKPAAGTGAGIGVSTFLTSYKESARAAILASLRCNELLVEQYIPGEIFRLLFVGGELISAVRRNGVRVVGDGETALDELIARKLGDGKGQEHWHRDVDIATTTSKQGWQPGTVLPRGKRALVKSNAELSRSHVEQRTVYNQEVTFLLASNLVEEARTAGRLLRSQFFGVDLILVDPTISLRSGAGVIGEVNTTPGLHHHYHVDSPGTRQDPATEVLKYLWRSYRRSTLEVQQECI